MDMVIEGWDIKECLMPTWRQVGVIGIAGDLDRTALEQITWW